MWPICANVKLADTDLGIIREHFIRPSEQNKVLKSLRNLRQPLLISRTLLTAFLAPARLVLHFVNAKKQ